MSDGFGMQVRECDRCGKEVGGMTAELAQKRLEDHYQRCQTDQRDHTNDCQLNITITPPREISQYEYTEHFQHMMTRRSDPDISGDVVETTLKRGLIKSTHKPQRVIFEWRGDRGWQWWVIAQLREEAFRRSDKSHLLLTVYAKDSDAHEKVEKYV